MKPYSDVFRKGWLSLNSNIFVPVTDIYIYTPSICVMMTDMTDLTHKKQDAQTVLKSTALRPLMFHITAEQKFAERQLIYWEDVNMAQFPGSSLSSGYYLCRDPGTPVSALLSKTGVGLLTTLAVKCMCAWCPARDRHPIQGVFLPHVCVHGINFSFTTTFSQDRTITK